LLPTVAHYNNLLVEDLGGRGPFCPPTRRNTNYSNNPADRDLSPGTFVFRPIVHDKYFHDAPDRFTESDLLYHPVKVS
jgi:hypothetical protein